jgi:hypothetical protein
MNDHMNLLCQAKTWYVFLDDLYFQKEAWRNSGLLQASRENMFVCILTLHAKLLPLVPVELDSKDEL